MVVTIIHTMRRPRHGGTSRPPYLRPGNGFGRPTYPGPLRRAPVMSDDEWRRALERWSVDVDLVTAERSER